MSAGDERPGLCRRFRRVAESALATRLRAEYRPPSAGPRRDTAKCSAASSMHIPSAAQFSLNTPEGNRLIKSLSADPPAALRGGRGRRQLRRP